MRARLLVATSEETEGFCRFQGAGDKGFALSKSLPYCISSQE